MPAPTAGPIGSRLSSPRVRQVPPNPPTRTASAGAPVAGAELVDHGGDGRPDLDFGYDPADTCCDRYEHRRVAVGAARPRQQPDPGEGLDVVDERRATVHAAGRCRNGAESGDRGTAFERIDD